MRAPLSISDINAPADEQDYDVLALHEALNDLAAIDSRQARIVELRCFGGLTEQETARVLVLSPVTIRRETAAAVKSLATRAKAMKRPLCMR